MLENEGRGATLGSWNEAPPADDKAQMQGGSATRSDIRQRT